MVFYFTATGNSLYVAKCIEEYPVSIPQVIKNSSIYSDNQIGIICPVYCGEIPNTVKEFLKESKFDTKYMYLILTYGNSASDCPEFTYNEFKFTALIITCLFLIWQKKRKLTKIQMFKLHI